MSVLTDFITAYNHLSYSDRVVFYNILLEVLIALATIGSWAHMFAKGGEGALSSRGYASLKYYTCLSNLFAGGVACVTAVFLLPTGGAGQMPMWLALLKLAAATSVLVTFIVVMAFLGPKFGYKPLLSEEQFFLHAAGPLMAMLAFVISPSVPEMKTSAALFAALPTVVYGLAYMGNILKNGVGEGENTNDWYGFVVGGLWSMPIAFTVIVAAAWAMAVGLLALRGLVVG